MVTVPSTISWRKRHDALITFDSKSDGFGINLSKNGPITCASPSIDSVTSIWEIFMWPGIVWFPLNVMRFEVLTPFIRPSVSISFVTWIN